MAHGRQREEAMMRKRELVRLKGWLSKLTRSQRKALARFAPQPESLLALAVTV
jgi:hypothetical protein